MHLIFQFPLLPILWLILGKEIFMFLFHNKPLLAESLMLQYFCVLFPGRCLRSDVISDDMMILGLKWAPRVTGDSWHLISNKLHSLLSPNKAICPLIGQQCSLWNTFWLLYYTTKHTIKPDSHCLYRKMIGVDIYLVCLQMCFLRTEVCPVICLLAPCLLSGVGNVWPGFSTG